MAMQSHILPQLYDKILVVFASDASAHHIFQTLPVLVTTAMRVPGHLWSTLVTNYVMCEVTLLGKIQAFSYDRNTNGVENVWNVFLSLLPWPEQELSYVVLAVRNNNIYLCSHIYSFSKVYGLL